MEIVCQRIRDNLREYLPGEIEKVQSYRSASDLSYYGKQIDVAIPRDDSEYNSYFIGEPAKIADYPAIILMTEGSNFDVEVNVAKNNFQYEEVQIKIIVFYKTLELSKRPEELEIGLMRLTDGVISVLRKDPFLRTTEDNNDPIANSMGIDGLIYHPAYAMNRAFFKASEFNVTYKVLDSIRTRGMIG